MELAIGNAPWPVGVTRSGLHQRPGSAKAYVSNVAHVLNDEVMRKVGAWGARWHHSRVSASTP